jgi:hypothetical protein
MYLVVCKRNSGLGWVKWNHCQCLLSLSPQAEFWRKFHFKWPIFIPKISFNVQDKPECFFLWTEVSTHWQFLILSCSLLLIFPLEKSIKIRIQTIWNEYSHVQTNLYAYYIYYPTLIKAMLNTMRTRWELFKCQIESSWFVDKEVSKAKGKVKTEPDIAPPVQDYHLAGEISWLTSFAFGKSHIFNGQYECLQEKQQLFILFISFNY